MPSARAFFSTSVINNRIYVIGGTSDDSQGISTGSTVLIYDPSTDTWSKGLGMPTYRFGLTAAEVNGKIYAIGGCMEATGNLKGIPTVE